jgi:hypothetical protein
MQEDTMYSREVTNELQHVQHSLRRTKLHIARATKLLETMYVTTTQELFLLRSLVLSQSANINVLLAFSAAMASQPRAVELLQASITICHLPIWLIL